MKSKIFCVITAVVLWMAGGSGAVFAQGPNPYEGCIGFYWDSSVEVETTETVTNQCVVESRQDGQVIDMITDTVSDCIPSFTPPAEPPLQCGSNLCFVLGVPRGESKIWVRCTWFENSTVLAYLSLDPPTTMDSDHFWLFKTVNRPYTYILPIIVKNAPLP